VGSIKYRGFLDQLRNFSLIRKDSAPWSLLDVEYYAFTAKHKFPHIYGSKSLVEL
jgi:hypothetical protein